MTAIHKTSDELVSDLKRLPAEQIKRAIITLLASKGKEPIDWEQAFTSEVVEFQRWARERRKNFSTNCSNRSDKLNQSDRFSEAAREELLFNVHIVKDISN